MSLRPSPSPKFGKMATRFAAQAFVLYYHSPCIL
jgi:hypothetical protein